MDHERERTPPALLEHPEKSHGVIAMAVAQDDGAEVSGVNLQDLHVLDQAVPGEARVEEERVAAAILDHRREG